MKGYLETQTVSSAIKNGYMKSADLTLISLAKRTFGSAVKQPSSEAVFFYPSAGSDLITPLVIALPYCNQFYFYDHDLAEPWLRSSCVEVFRYLKQIKGIDTSQRAWLENANGKTLMLKYYGINKALYWVNEDNINFLSKAHLKLTFYFHRGDSYGEGGSRQFWDSTLLPYLRNMIAPGGCCYFITDGEPGGPAYELMNNVATIEKGASHVKYYFGQLTCVR